MEDLKECQCNFHQKMVGDGCQVCNPKLAAEIEADNLAELKADAARYRWIRANSYIELQCSSPKVHDWNETMLDERVDAAMKVNA